MHMSKFRKLVLIWMILWLPASGAIAAVMPISGMPAGKITAIMLGQTETADMATGAADQVSAMPCHQTAAIDSSPSGTCTHCVLCHLAISLMLPAIPEMKPFTPSHDFAATLLLSHTSFFPEPVSPPPRPLIS